MQLFFVSYMRKCGNSLYLCCEKVHSVLHSATEIMRWGDLINTSGEAPEQSHKINVKAPEKNLNHHSSSSGPCKEKTLCTNVG